MKKITSVTIMLAIVASLAWIALMPGAAHESHKAQPLLDIRKMEQALPHEDSIQTSDAQRNIQENSSAALVEIWNMGPLFGLIFSVTVLCTTIMWLTWKFLNALRDALVLFVGAIAILISEILHKLWNTFGPLLRQAISRLR